MLAIVAALQTVVLRPVSAEPPAAGQGEQEDRYGEFALPTEGQAADLPAGEADSSSGESAPSSEDGLPGEVASEGDGSAAEAASSSGPAPEPSATPRPEDLLPLDAWIEPTPVPTATPVPTPTPQQELNGTDPAEEEEEEESEEPEVLQIPVEKTTLNAAQKRRLEAARKEFRRRVREGRKAYLDYYNRDPRGESEVRLCSLNLNNLGEAEDIKRLLSQKEARRLRAKRRSVMSAIDTAKCDIVAVQGLVGKDFGGSQDTLAALAKELSEASSTNWRYYVGLSNNKNANNGVLIGNPDFEMLKIRSYNQNALPLENGFRLKNFSRDPFQIDLRVPGKGDAPARTLSIITFQFQDLLKPKGEESEKKRMQMAEGLRQIVSTIQSESAAEDPPVVIVAGDFSAARTKVSARMLEGTIRLSDFGEEGPCKLAADEKVSCDPKPAHPKLLFGILTDSFGQVDERAKTAIRRHTLMQALRRREEIYMTAPDLRLAWSDHKAPGRYNAGSEKVRNGLKDCPLVWVELNW